MPSLDRYIAYIKNTGLAPLPASVFDDDHDPIGPQIREDLAREFWIVVGDDGIRLVSDIDDQVLGLAVARASDPEHARAVIAAGYDSNERDPQKRSAMWASLWRALEAGGSR